MPSGIQPKPRTQLDLMCKRVVCLDMTKTTSDCGLFDAPCPDREADYNDYMAARGEEEFQALPLAERLPVLLDGARVRSHLTSCPVVPAAPVDYDSIPF